MMRRSILTTILALAACLAGCTTVTGVSPDGTVFFAGSLFSDKTIGDLSVNKSTTQGVAFHLSGYQSKADVSALQLLQVAAQLAGKAATTLP